MTLPEKQYNPSDAPAPEVIVRTSITTTAAVIHCLPWRRYSVSQVDHGPPKNFGCVDRNAFGPANNSPVCLFGKMNKV